MTIYTNVYPTKICLFCNTKMNISIGKNLKEPTKPISISGIALMTYVCPTCGFVACFSADIIKK